MKIKEMIRKKEQGRSMVEMLGVLAIIGVLSIGGIAGYTMSINRHKANQIVDMGSKLSVLAQTKGVDPNNIQAVAEMQGELFREMGIDDAWEQYETTFWVEPEGNVSIWIDESKTGLRNAVKSVAGDEFQIIVVD